MSILGRYLRIEGLSEHEFAAESGVPQSVVNRVKNVEPCSLLNAWKIVQATGGAFSLDALADELCRRRR